MQVTSHGVGYLNFEDLHHDRVGLGGAAYMEEVGVFPSSVVHAAGHGVGLTIFKAYTMVGRDFLLFWVGPCTWRE